MQNGVNAVHYASNCQALLKRAVLHRQILTNVEVHALTCGANRGIFVPSSPAASPRGSSFRCGPTWFFVAHQIGSAT